MASDGEMPSDAAMAAPGSMPGIPVTQYHRDLVVAFFASNSCLCVLALSILSWRIYTKLQPGFKLGADDGFIIVGFIFALVDFLILIPTSTPLVGSHPLQFMSMELYTYGYKTAFFAIMIWSAAMTCIKVSAVLTLLRFLQSRAWRVFLWSVIALQAMMLVGNILYLLLQCRPIRNAWNIAAPKSSCLNLDSSTDITIVISVINVVTDIILSVVPLTFLATLNRPFRERVLIIILMATGLLASAATIRRLLITTEYSKPGVDFLALNLTNPTWTCAEEFLAVTAVCMPTLKNPIQKLLAAMGFVVGWESASNSNSGGNSEAFKISSGTKNSWATSDVENSFTLVAPGVSTGVPAATAAPSKDGGHEINLEDRENCSSCVNTRTESLGSALSHKSKCCVN